MYSFQILYCISLKNSSSSVTVVQVEAKSQKTAPKGKIF